MIKPFRNLIGLIIVTTSSQVVAQEIEELVIRHIYAADQSSPVTYQDIDKQELQKVDLQEPSFLLQKTPSILSYSDSGSFQGYSYFRLRGIDQTRINMTLDGIPLNEPEDQGVYFSNYPGVFGSLDKIQIQRGVGTSQNGTASYAGSIQLYSIDHNAEAYSEVETGYGSYNSYFGSLKYLSGLQQQKSLYVNLSGVSSDGYKNHSGNQSHSVLFSGLKEDESGAWRLLGFSGKQQNQLAWIGVEKVKIDEYPRANANTENENDRYSQSLISLAREQKLGDRLQWETRIYYNWLSGSYDFDFNNFIGLPSTDELFNYALKSDFYGGYSNLYFKSDVYDLSFGVHLNNYQRNHIGSEKNSGRLYSNTGYKDSYAAFIKYNYYWNDLNLFADIQHRYTDFDYQGDVDFSKLDWQFTNPRVGVSYQLTDSWLLYYSLGKTGREPTRTDLFGGMDNLEYDQSGQPALYIVDPESVVNHESGFRYQSNQLSWEANLFYMDFDKEITLNGSFGPNGLLLNQDVDKSIRKGIETTLDLTLASTIHWKNSVSYTRASVHDHSQTFSPVMTPEWITQSALEYQQEKYALGINWRYQSDAYVDLANTNKLDAYSVVDAYWIFRFSGLEYQLSVNNLLDKFYLASGAINASGQPAYFVGAARNYHFSVKAQF